MKKLISVLLVLVLASFVLISCSKKQTTETTQTQTTTTTSTSEKVVEEKKTYTMYDYTAVSPSNWNELTYQDNNDTQVMGKLASPFFEFDFKFDENGDAIRNVAFIKKADTTTGAWIFVKAQSVD